MDHRKGLKQHDGGNTMKHGELYRHFVQELCQYFGVRRHAAGICKEIESGNANAFDVANLLIEGEVDEDCKPSQFMCGFCNRVTITSQFKENSAYMSGHMLHYGKLVKVDIWMQNRQGVKIGDTLKVEFSGDIVGKALECHRI